jgi:hypothetical protein
MGGKGEASVGVSFYRGRRGSGGDCGPTCQRQDASDVAEAGPWHVLGFPVLGH